MVPYDLEQQRKETREMLDNLTTRDQRMMFAVVTLVYLADSKEELDSDTDALRSTARKHLCQLATAFWTDKGKLCAEQEKKLEIATVYTHKECFVNLRGSNSTV